MAHLQQTMNTKTIEAGMGRNSLINDLATRRVYDNAVEELNHRSRRPKINFTKVISQEQVIQATNSYPEFEITFYGTQQAVHSFAGGLRALELEYLMMQIPFGSTTYDIGGNFSAHLYKGRDYVHCCMPNLDIRDIARHVNQQDSVETYLARLERSKRGIPSFQQSAFNRYAERPDDVCCDKKFQECTFVDDSSKKKYAIALHSIYDIPVDEFGAALLRKDIHICYAAFHFSENLLLDTESAPLEEIGATFCRSGDKLSFFFQNESTLNYEHSYSNVIKYVCKTFFPASNRFVYHKEFMCTRVNTWFCKFTKIDTFFLFRGVYSRGADAEQFYTAMDEAWEYKKSLAMLNSERTIFKDHSAVNFWFPKVRDMVIVPLFNGSITSGKMRRSEIMVNKDFVYTVLNHIRTYQAKALTYQNVLSFVESIRSRVIINGVTARSEWDVDKAVLQPLAMTFFLQTKLASVKDEIVLNKFMKFDETVSDLIWKEISGFFGDIFPSIKERLVSGGFVKVAEKSLEINVPDQFVTFTDRLITEYKASEELPHLDITKPLERAEKFYNALSELSVLDGCDEFDIDQFKKLCDEKSIDPDVVAKVIVSIMKNELTLPFQKPSAESLSEALSPLPADLDHRFDMLKLSSAAPYPCMKNLPQGKLPKQSFGDERQFEAAEVSSISEFHLKSVEAVRMKHMSSAVYTGSLKVQQMKNYIDYLSASISASVSNLCKVLRDVHGVDPDTTDKSGVFDVAKNKWLLKPKDKCHAWGVVELLDSKLVIALLEWSDGFPICGEDWRRVAVSTDSLIYSDMGKLQTLHGCLKDGEPIEPKAKITIVDGVPGCGKTKEILETVNFDEDLVLVPGKEACKMIIKRANSSGVVRATKDNVRTVDSFLMHLKPKCYKRLFIDEGLMLHTGCVNFLVLLSGCDDAFVYGDTEQIPFINRIANFPYPSHFSKLVFDKRELRRVTLRCPADVTHFMNSKYDGKVMCTSDVVRSVDTEVVRGKGVFNPKSKPLKGKIITFTQSDKAELKEKGYEDVSTFAEINTVHEIQGETYSDVSVVRLTATPLEIVSKTSPHLLVALTRHTKSFKYYTVVLDPLVKVCSDLSKISDFILDMYKVESGVL
ncbi:replication-associated protein [Piper chlorosis virus]|nr:replication-associated protein [Piper chlorosis virus]